MVTLNLPLAINIVKTNYILYIEVFCNCFFLQLHTTFHSEDIAYRFSYISTMHHIHTMYYEYLSDSQNVLNNLKDYLQFKQINLFQFRKKSLSFYYYQIFILLLKMYVYSNYS